MQALFSPVKCVLTHVCVVPLFAAPTELIDLYKTADAGATVALMGKHAVERSFSSKLDDVRSGESQRRGATVGSPAVGSARPA